MFHFILPALRYIRPIGCKYLNVARITSNDIKTYSTFNKNITSLPCNGYTDKSSLLYNKQILNIAANLSPVIPVRTVTKYSLKKGKRKTVKAVVRRFFRLHWGGWIRTKCGREKKMWKKSVAQRKRLKEHVFCNATQCTLLDKMVTKFWKRPKYYVNDPYAPYHTREEFPITRKNPMFRD